MEKLHPQCVKTGSNERTPLSQLIKFAKLAPVHIYNNAPEMQILFGQSETPTRIFVGIQSSDAFTGLFNKSAFAFDRRWAKAATVTSSFEAPVTFHEPQIPPMIHIALVTT